MHSLSLTVHAPAFVKSQVNVPETGHLGSHTSATSRHEARRARQAGWTTAAADSPLAMVIGIYKPHPDDGLRLRGARLRRRALHALVQTLLLTSNMTRHDIPSECMDSSVARAPLKSITTKGPCVFM